MKRFSHLFLGLAVVAATALARTPESPPSLDHKVRHELLMLPYIGVFDNLKYAVDDNGVVTLSGAVVLPIDKQDAVQAVKSIAGVTAVEDQIELLPLSPVDDRIRLATFRTLNRATPLSRYFWGVHPDIRIIVKNGHVALEGTVLNEGDRTQAFLVANSVPGVFSVTNNLETEKPAKSK